MFLEFYLGSDEDVHIDLLAQVEVVAQLKLLRALANTIYSCKTEKIPKKQLLEFLGEIYSNLMEILDVIICKDFPTLNSIVVKTPKEEQKT
ncbi:MAG: hypothetical protein J7L07_04065 [Candidatus Odinarchaeota archaeon]|nr:hypothetical protein [Candidatus Odinarchaeota archaeon]